MTLAAASARAGALLSLKTRIKLLAADERGGSNSAPKEGAGNSITSPPPQGGREETRARHSPRLEETRGRHSQRLEERVRESSPPRMATDAETSTAVGAALGGGRG